MELTARSLILLAALVAGCGSDSDDGNDSGGHAGTPSEGCSGPELSDASLCKLSCMQTTPGEAKAALGTPTSSTSAGSVDLLQYTRQCIAGSSVQATTWAFYFSSDALTQVSVTNVGTDTELPACLADCHP